MIQKVKLILAAWLTVSLILIIAIGFSLKSRDLFELPPIVAEYESSISGEQIENIVIDGENLAVELIGSVETSEITIQLFGDNYGGQRAYLYEENDTLTVQFDNQPPLPSYIGYSDVQPLGMRIIVPAKEYKEIYVENHITDLWVFNMEGKEVNVQLQEGSIVIEESVFQRVNIDANDANTSLIESEVSLAEVESRQGTIVIGDTKSGLLEARSDSGKIEVDQEKLSGVYQLESIDGDIRLITKKNPRYLVGDFISQHGVIYRGYTGEWKDYTTILINDGEGQRLAVEIGKGNTIVEAITDTGNIELYRKKQLK